jgi:anti-anti-sigma regulatory factor
LQQANPTVSTSNESLVIAMRTHVHRDDGGAVITIAGTFDTTDVDELGMVARSLYPTGTVVLDFHEVEVLSDCASRSSRASCSNKSGHVVLVGMSEHHHRLLRYVGGRGGRGRNSARLALEAEVRLDASMPGANAPASSSPSDASPLNTTAQPSALSHSRAHAVARTQAGDAAAPRPPSRTICVRRWRFDDSARE